MAEGHREALLLDACVVINLLASGISLEEFAEVLRTRFIVTERVAQEAIFLPNDAGDRERIDLTAHVVPGVIDTIQLEQVELEDFVAFAAEVDDGEASTLAAAVHRGLPVATDDRKARRVGSSQTPPVVLVSTPELLRRCESGWLDSRLGEAVRRIEHRASFRPRRDDPGFEWWLATRDR